LNEEILDKASCHRLIQQLAENRGEPLVKIAQPIRVALTGKTASPPIDEVLEVLGKAKVIQRLQKAIAFIEHKKL
jgi:glutamyl-tRNA synthetase